MVFLQPSYLMALIFLNLRFELKDKQILCNYSLNARTKITAVSVYLNYILQTQIYESAFPLMQVILKVCRFLGGIFFL